MTFHLADLCMILLACLRACLIRLRDAIIWLISVYGVVWTGVVFSWWFSLKIATTLVSQQLTAVAWMATRREIQSPGAKRQRLDL